LYGKAVLFTCMGTYPFDKRYNITSTFQGHLGRKPASRMPGTDYATPMGTPIYASFSGWMQSEDSKSLAGAIGLSITSSDKTVKYILIHLSQVVSSHRQVNEGDLIGYSGNTGKSTGPHTHISAKRPWNGKYYDCQAELQNMPLKSEAKTPTVDVIVYEKQIAELKSQLEAKTIQNTERIALLNLEILSRQNQLAELSIQNEALNKYAAMYNLSLTDAQEIIADVVEETADIDGWLNVYGRLVDKYIKSETLKNIFKYDIFVWFGQVITAILTIGVAPFLNQAFGWQVNDMGALVIGLILGAPLKSIKLRYDSNRDGRITSDDYIILK